MSHLSSERLAELADGEPTIAEAEHLAACATCATERSAHRRLLSLAGDERGRIAPPLTDWNTLSARLRAEGIITVPGVATLTSDPAITPVVTPRRHRRAWLAGLRIAAGILVATGFGALGRLSAGASPMPTGRELASTAQRVLTAGDDELLPPIGGNLADFAPFASVDEALDVLARSQQEYDRAASFIAAHDSTPHSPDAGEMFRTRLAALDEMAETSRQALSAAPTDPVLNQYYLSTLGAREVTLRQLGSVLTPGKRLTRF